MFKNIILKMLVENSRTIPQLGVPEVKYNLEMWVHTTIHSNFWHIKHSVAKAMLGPGKNGKE